MSCIGNIRTASLLNSLALKKKLYVHTRVYLALLFISVLCRPYTYILVNMLRGSRTLDGYYNYMRNNDV